MKRDFLTFSEAVTALGGDTETFRQVLLRNRIRAFFELSNQVGFAYPYEDGTYPANGRTEYCDWSNNVFTEDSNESEVVDDAKPYNLNGWFFVPYHYLKALARRQECMRWGFSLNNGTDEFPIFEFDVQLSGRKLESFWFLADDVIAISQGAYICQDPWSDAISKPLAGMEGAGLPAPQAELIAKSPRLRPDRETNLLRIVAGIWALSDLDPKPYTTATKLLDEMQLWNWDKPERDTIAKTLTEAAVLAKGKHPKFR